MGIGKKIELSRREMGLTQIDLSEKTGIERTTISLYENGKVKKIGLENLTKIANAVGKPLTFFAEDGREEDIGYEFMHNYQHLLKILATMDKEKIQALITLLQ
jgi:transcriptional regulator with XRE-family HTH domain